MPETLEILIRFETPFGITEPQESVVVELEEDEVVEFEPEYMPEEATAWIPEFVSANPGGKKQLPKKKRGETATIGSSDPEEIPDETTDSKPTGKRKRKKAKDGTQVTTTAGTAVSEEDDSGIDGPDSALSDIVPIGITIPVPGLYKYKLTKWTIDPDDDKEGESAPSPVAEINVPAGYYVKARPPLDYHNWIPNAEGSVRRADATGAPEVWQQPAAAGVTPNNDTPGVQEFADTANTATDVEVVRTGVMDVSSQPVLTHRVVVEIENYETGDVDIVLKQTLANATVTETILGSVSGNGEHEILAALGPVGEPGVDTTWAATVASAQIVGKHIGTRGGKGPRKLKSRIKHPGVHRGKKKHPRKRRPHHRPHRPHKPPIINPPVEDPELPYPSYGYVTIVENPPNADRPILNGVAGTYVPGNMIEYYGPEGTPVVSTFFMSGMKYPVKPGEVRTLSTHFYWAGVDQAATPLKAVLKDRDGFVLQDLGTFEAMSGVTGNSSDELGADVNGWVRRPLTVVVPEEGTAAYIELVAGGCGDGLIRIMGFQNELGFAMTNFDISVAPTGSLISTFDMGIPGIPRGAFPTQDGIARLVRIGAEVTHDPGGATSHVVAARSKTYDAAEYPATWITAIEDLEINDLIQVRTVLSTSDLEVSPVFHSQFLDFERETGGAGFGILCRGDGTEFDGGAVLYDFPPVRPEKPIIEEEFADNSGGFAVMGLARDWARGFGVEFYLDSAAEEFMRLQGEGLEEDGGESDDLASMFIGEIFGLRNALRILDAAVTPVNREAHVNIAGLGSNGKWLLQADGIDAEVLGREAF